MNYPTLIHERVALAKEKRNPAVICRMPSGWAVIGDSQFLPGYCLLLADPVVPSLNEMDVSHRSNFLNDMALIGDALLECTEAYRINYEILGNHDAALHAHIFPRYLSEPADRIKGPVWYYPHDLRQSVKIDYARDRLLIDSLREEITSKLPSI
jgi:diadenosine tetraphosphate (Ap4A) HIT family hydrolase